MYDTPQTFASKAAIIELLKRTPGASLTRPQVLETTARELGVSPEEIARALVELRVEDQIVTVVVDGEERIQFAPVAH
jgi:prolyl-tRNA editing enzyme YbaK/EbsC (Cys-tRNA(Pro) deacylase)